MIKNPPEALIGFVYWPLFKFLIRPIIALFKLSFPKLEDIEVEDNRIGHIIKYNITERLFYSPLQKTNLMKLYDLQSYQLNNYSIEKVKPILLRNKKIYMAVN